MPPPTRATKSRGEVEQLRGGHREDDTSEHGSADHFSRSPSSARTTDRYAIGS